MAIYRVNDQAVAFARDLIRKHRYVIRSQWSEVQPNADKQNAYLGRHGWEAYAAWHLGLTEGATDGRRDGTRSSWAISPA